MSDVGHEHDDGYELLVPFTVSASHGGPFNDDAYTAGWEMGLLWQRCKLMAPMEVPAIMATIHRTNLPQADLIAMHFDMHCCEIKGDDVSAITGDGWSAICITIEKPEDDL